MATTYTYTFDMTEHQTGTAGHYPLKVGSASYSSETTMFAKAGDTVEYKLSEPSPDSGNVHYLNNVDPDPDEGTGAQSSPSTWSRTLTGSDTSLQWMWFGATYYNPSDTSQGRKYSNKVITALVAGTFTNSDGASVEQGGTITFTVSGTGSLPNASGSSNYLYIAIRKGGTMVHTNHTAAGMYWDSGNNQLGKVHNGDLSTVMTVGTSMATGTDYTAHLYHYNPTVSEPFYNPVNQLDSVTFSITAPPTGTVSGLNLGANVTATTLSQVVTRNSGTITCDPTTFQPTSSVSNQAGAAGAKQRLGGTSNSYSTSDLTLNNGESVDFWMVGPSGYNATTTGRLTIAEDHDDLSVTTGSDPGGGEGGGGGATAGTYGLKITNADGDQIFGVGQKGNTVILTETRSALAHNATDGPFTLPVAAADNISTKVAIVIIDMYTGTTGFNWPQWVITRSGATFSVQNLSGVSRAYRYIAIRI